MLTGDDVLDVESEEVSIVFVQLTILATVTSAVTHECPKRRLHFWP
jgi:hypothetical protein